MVATDSFTNQQPFRDMAVHNERFQTPMCTATLFIFIISEHILGSIAVPGIAVDGDNINNLRYADDTFLIAAMQTNLQRIIDTEAVRIE